MRRFIPALLLSLTLGFTAQAQFTLSGSMKLEFGRGVKNGKGAYIPWVAQYLGPPIPKFGWHPPFATKPGPVHVPGAGYSPQGGGGGNEDFTTVYMNDNGDGSYIISQPELPLSSTLDDMQFIAAGVNAPWKTLTMGISTDTEERFLIRWKVYFTYTQGRGAGVNAFDPDPPANNRDFGGYIQLPVGTYKITFNIASVGCTVVQQQAYIAEQFRYPQFPENGEGPFNEAVQGVYSGGGGPTIGSSQDVFWFDWDPINGIYSEDEVDNFGGSPNEANMLFIVQAGGTAQETVLPTNYTVTVGTPVSGTLSSLWNNDSNYLVARNGAPFSPVAPSLILTVEGGITPGNPIEGFDFLFDGKTSVPNIVEQIDLFNYTLNRWVNFTTRFTTTSDSQILVVVPNNPQQYISSQNRIKARIAWYDDGTLPVISWTASTDQAIWHINRF